MLFKDIFDSFTDSEDILGIYPDFKVRVVAVGAISPSHPKFEFYLDSTKVLIDRLFAGQTLGRTAIHPTFVFPERWMSPIQIQQFMNTLAHSVDAKMGKIKIVDIITGSAVILTDFTSDMVKIYVGESNENI